ncbi:hypothetical protein ACFE04_029072 [Oxalis oulophora]
MSSLSRELVFLILQFLEEEKFKDSVHRLEKESGFFFNMKFFEEKVQAGEWDEVEKYLSGFTKVDDNRYSMKIFFEIRKQKYLEALDRQDKAKAVEILVTDLKVFSTFNEELYKEITQLLTLTNFRENEQLSKYGDTKTARSIMLIELKKLIEANPLFRDKLVFPPLKSSRLRTLINQSLNWQHQLCKNPRPNPDIKTLFTDHMCTPPNGPLAPAPVNLPVAAVAKPATYTPLGAHGPFPPAGAVAGNASGLASWMANASGSSSVQAAVVTASSMPVPQNQVPVLKRPRTPPTNNPGMADYQTPDHEQLMKRLRPAQSVEEVTYPTTRQQASNWSLDDLPRTVALTLHQGSTVTSMDFHPSHHTILLVGSANGEVTLWELGLREKLLSKPFKVWDMQACSLSFQASMVKETPISVSRVTWSPDGNFVGAAFTKHLIHLYAYAGSNELNHRLEIEAHVGSVNDMAFAHPNKQLCVVTCGDDKLIKVWDAVNGRKLFNFEGHEAPVYSICPHHKENIQFIFSTAVDGKIKAWLYDNMGSRVDYDAPGHWCTTMLYSADGNRLFSCGTSKDGDSFLVEWNESEGAIKRTYTGFRKKSDGVVQFDATQNHFLAAGEDSQIKFWDMDNMSVLTTTDAEGGLPSLPRLRFNKDGNLLAVTTADNGFKILANAVGLRSIKTVENPPFEALRMPTIDSAAIKANAGASNAVTSVAPVNCKVERSSPVRPSPVLNGRSMEKPRTGDDIDKAKPWQLVEIVDSAHCRLVSCPDSTDTSSKVVRLLYTNSGVGILALGSNGVQKLWKWSRNEQNPTGKLCVWSIDTWEKRKFVAIQLPAGKVPNGETRVQFHSDQIRMLVSHETQLAIYDASKMERIRQWVPKDMLPAPISSAVYSCNSQLVYATFCDGNVGVFDADTLRLRCRIASSVYLSPAALNGSQPVHPLVVAAHPLDPNQFAVGLADGSFKVMEPKESEGKWGVTPPVDNGLLNSRATSSSATSNHNTPDQLQR